METAILVYVGVDNSAMSYPVESFQYVFGGEGTQRTAQVLQQHGMILMAQHPRKFVMVPDNAGQKVLLMGTPLNAITGIFNLDTDDKAKLIEGGFQTVGELLTVTPIQLLSYLTNRDEAYVTLMQTAIKERFDIPTDLAALNAARGSAEPTPPPESINPDNFTVLANVGEASQTKLYEANIKTFAQLAAQDADHVASVIGGTMTATKAQAIIDEAKTKVPSS